MVLLSTMEYSILWLRTLVLTGILSTTLSADTSEDAVIPRFTAEPRSKVVVPGAKVVLYCRVTPRAATVTWQRDGTPLPAGGAGGVGVQGDQLNILQYVSGGGGHAGRYRCRAENSLGAVVSRPALLQTAVLGKFKGPTSDLLINVTVGNVALIPCSPPTGTPPTRTVFQRNGITIETSSARYRLMPSGSLQVGGVRPEDGGTYRCVAVNPRSGERRPAPNTAHLRVTAPLTNISPRFVTPSEQTVQAKVGGNITLECVIEGAPVPVVNWEKYGGHLRPEHRYNQVLGNLEISSVGRYDAGTYICSGLNGRSQSSEVSIFIVEVLEPPVLRAPPYNQVGALGGTAKFHCHFQAQPRAQVAWYHNGQLLTRSNDTEITETSLRISPLQSHHAGLYQCEAQSPLGSASETALLRVVARGDNTSSLEAPQSEMRPVAPGNPVTAPRLSSTPSDTTIQVGDSVTLECRSDDLGQYGTSMIWLKDSRLIPGLDGIGPLAANSQNMDPLRDSRPSSGVTRQGRGRSSAGTHQGEDADVDGISAVHIHKRAVLPETSGDRAKSRAKRRRKRNRFRMTEFGSLIVRNVRREDAGNYTCIVANDGGSASDTAALSVTGRADLDSFLDNGGGPITMPEPDDPSNPDGGRQGGRGREKNRGRDGDRPGRRRGGGGRRGKKNKNRRPTTPGEGETEESRGIVMDPPSKPMVTKISDSSVMLEWDKRDVGLAVKFFKAQYRDVTPGHGSNWKTTDKHITSDMRRCEVGELTAGNTYVFRILAVFENNDNKEGPRSRRFTLQTDSPPSPPPPPEGPTITVASPYSSTVMDLQWQFSDSSGFLIDGFYIFYKPYSEPGQYNRLTVYSPYQREYQVSNLKPETNYSFKMQCFNDAGSSADGNSVVKVTPKLRSDQVGGIPKPIIPTGLTFITVTTPNHGTERKGHTTASSSETMYMALGVALGGALLVLLIMVGLCWWRQQQQYRLMGGAGAPPKYPDAARPAYTNDSLLKPATNGGHFLLNGINGSIPNGTGPPSYPQRNLNNVTANPMVAHTMLGAPPGGNERQYGSQDIRGLQEMLGPLPPPPPPPQSYQDDQGSVSGSIRMGRYDSQQSIENNNSRVIESGMSTFGKRRPRQHNNLPGYHGNPDNYENSYNRSHDPSPYSPSHDPSLYMRSHDPGLYSPRSHGQYPSLPRSHDVRNPHMTDYIPRSHERTQYRPVPGRGSPQPTGNAPSFQNSLGRGPHPEVHRTRGSHLGVRDNMYDRTPGYREETVDQEGQSEHSYSSSSQVSGRHRHRRRRKHSGSREQLPHPVGQSAAHSGGLPAAHMSAHAAPGLSGGSRLISPEQSSDDEMNTAPNSRIPQPTNNLNNIHHHGNTSMEENNHHSNTDSNHPHRHGNMQSCNESDSDDNEEYPPTQPLMLAGHMPMGRDSPSPTPLDSAPHLSPYSGLSRVNDYSPSENDDLDDD